MATSRRFGTIEAALNFIDLQPINTVRQMLAEFLVESPVDKIVITEAQFKQMFKIRGVSYDPQTGEERVEKRGRKPKKIEEVAD